MKTKCNSPISRVKMWKPMSISKFYPLVSVLDGPLSFYRSTRRTFLCSVCLRRLACVSTGLPSLLASSWIQPMREPPERLRERQECSWEHGNLQASIGVPVVAQWLTNPASFHEDAGSIPSLGPSICSGCGPKKTKKKKRFFIFKASINRVGTWEIQSRSQSEKFFFRDDKFCHFYFLLSLSSYDPELDPVILLY